MPAILARHFKFVKKLQSKNEVLLNRFYVSKQNLRKSWKSRMHAGKLGCGLTFFRLIVNEFSTGLCIFASAFIRYCLICHPTSDLLTKNRMIALSACLVGAIITVLAVNAWDMSANFRPIEDGQSDYDYGDFDYEYDYGQYADFKLPRFIFNCAHFSLR